MAKPEKEEKVFKDLPDQASDTARENRHKDQEARKAEREAAKEERTAEREARKAEKEEEEDVSEPPAE